MRAHASAKAFIPLLAAIAFQTIAMAERLPLRHYTTQDGLSGNTVHSIVRDSRGLLWFCTNDGLARFDGRSFVIFGTEQGLGDQEVMHFLETSDGTYWVGTARGVSVLNRGASDPLFTNLLPDSDRRAQWVQRLLQDRKGNIWIATNGGLYRAAKDRHDKIVFEHILLPWPESDRSAPRMLAVLEDSSGHIWAGGDRGLYRYLGDGKVERYSRADGLPGNVVLAIASDHTGGFWVGADGGLAHLTPRTSGRAVVDRVIRASDGLPDAYVTAVQPSGQDLWAGTINGLVHMGLVHMRPGRHADLHVFGTAHGLSHSAIEALTEDANGDLWIGSMGGGALRLIKGGFTTFGSSDGLLSRDIVGLFDCNDGDICAISRQDGHFSLSRFNGHAFVSGQPRLPPDLSGLGWGWAQIAAQGQFGGWWIATAGGVAHYAVKSLEQLVSAKPSATLRTSRELKQGTVFRVFADSRGDIWISTAGYRAHGLSRLMHSTGRIQHFGEEDGLPGPAADDRSLASAFAEDAEGSVWIGFHRGGLFRFRDGRLAEIASREHVPIEGVRSIYRDSLARLWVAGRRGLVRIDDPTSENPALRHYGTSQGLASSFVLSVTGDHLGRIYAGSGRGVDRLEPNTGRVRHFGPEDGLVGGDIRLSLRDRHGQLWFGSAEGLSRYDPRKERPVPVPQVLISKVRIGTRVHVVPHPGQAEVAVPPVSWRDNHLYTEFLGAGDRLRYECRLEGVDDTAWSDATDSRNFQYPGLGAGPYRFLVRAVNAEGVRSAQNAVISFTIEPPFWKSLWFRCTILVFVSVALMLLHRIRLARAIEVERIRSRIATDLHDDVGASLCHAALLSDLVDRDLTGSAPAERVSERVAQISSVCRDAVDAMADIVWSIDPEKDNSGDLVQRMRRFAQDMLEHQGIELRFTHRGLPDVIIPPDIRHHTYLAYKETVHNLVRHSRATVAEIGIEVEANTLVLSVADNGHGLPTDGNADGHGLRSLRDRVKAMDGEIAIEPSVDGAGTSIWFRIPVKKRGH